MGTVRRGLGPPASTGEGTSPRLAVATARAGHRATWRRALGEGIEDIFERWVLLVETEIDREADALNTQYAAADISDGTLALTRAAGLEAVALSRALADAHVQRVQTQSKWAFPREALKLAEPQQRRLIKEHARG
jgi:hypothetical protein